MRGSSGEGPAEPLSDPARVLDADDGRAFEGGEVGVPLIMPSIKARMNCCWSPSDPAEGSRPAPPPKRSNGDPGLAEPGLGVLVLVFGREGRGRGAVDTGVGVSSPRNEESLEGGSVGNVGTGGSIVRHVQINICTPRAKMTSEQMNGAPS